MPDTPKKTSKQSDWLKLMLEGQLTRDRVLKTKTEIEEDKKRAEELESRRQSSIAASHHRGTRPR